MSYVCNISLVQMKKEELFSDNLQEMARFARAVSHPARLAILRYLANTRVCISGDISSQIPLGRTTVSQHLKELKEVGLIHARTEGTRIFYCLCPETIQKYFKLFEVFFKPMTNSSYHCNSNP